MARASKWIRRPTSPSPKPTISRIASRAIIEPMTPASAPSTPASAQLATVPGGGASVAGREIVGAVEDEVIAGDDGGRIAGIEAQRMGLDRHVLVQGHDRI